MIEAERLISKGLSIIPIKPDKTPAISSWRQHQETLPKLGQYAFNECIGLVCGPVSGNVEIIDVDVKNYSGDRDEFIEAIQARLDEAQPGLKEKFVIQMTPSTGFHFIYKCEAVEGNQVLARSLDRRAIIETRGIGGYGAISPTPGYKLVHGSFDEINEITSEERETAFEVFRSFNEFFEVVKPKAKLTEYPHGTRVTPWDDYNQKADVDSFLLNHDWVRSGSDGKRDYYRRPGKSKGCSASYNLEMKLFYCFTSSTQLNPGEAYTPAALFTHFECNGDFTEAAKKLYEMGYGERVAKRNSLNRGHEAHSLPTASCLLFRQTKPTSMERPKQFFGTLWAQGENAMFFGEDGSCKTICATQIGSALASGQSIGPFKNEVEAQPVALFDAELSDYQFNTRWPEGLPEMFKRFTFAEEQQAALVNADANFVINQIELAASSINAKIIILDNLAALTSMLDLTKTTDSIQVMGLLNELKRKGYSTLIIDHCRKPMKEGEFKAIFKSDLQGSKMKSNLVDSVFAIGKSAMGDNYRYIKALKIRSFEMAYGKNEVATMLLRPDPLRLEFHGIDPEWKHTTDRSSQMMRMQADGKTQAEIAEKFGVSQQAVSKFFRSAYND